MNLQHETKRMTYCRVRVTTKWNGIEVAYCEVVESDDFVELEGFVTFDSYRHNGIGTAVIEFIATTFKKDIHAMCYKCNDACTFYEKKGFKINSACEEFNHYLKVVV